ncbi:ATP-binding protein [Pasteurella multocida]|uniref:ATP-dependent nuclease n=2 Tax=Pasteurella multocida TaxID=747 RepID=UPI0007ECFF49|nr:AAA family ATPase [Pasteurella multocida]MCL7839664.1 ATP-binding protein [Pasteurella multocida]OBP34304.1 hypothetical protein A0R69_06170 [Pasteurella multocida subsp. multocida]PNM10308.1 hypothetical protein A6J59_006455 [Pasteurella multocida]URH92095.1 ATP-binding protein [Pasteurella multocida]URI04794.1 ATP-binding protein [Pasteurella multocida]
MKYIADTLYIEKFRKLRDETITFGSRINVFSGQNGVGKSNLLSLIATLFGTKDKRASGGNFFPEFNDYFKINSEEEFKEYKSHLKVLVENNSENIIQKRHGYKDSRKEGRGIRIVPRASTYFSSEKKHQNNISNDSKIPVPTIFLSLSRLFPVGETEISSRGIRSDNRNFNLDTFQKYIQWYNRVLPDSIDKTIETGRLIHKSVVTNHNLHIELKDATPETQSVGQDNLGCIISALVDFYILKNTITDKYIGGILCIDEIDASLHPSAQLKLFELLVDVSEELSLQIFLSTHSLTILKETLRAKSKKEKEYQLIYIIDPMQPRVSSISMYEELKADLFDQTNYFRPTVKVYCEDDMTQFILNELLSKSTIDLIDTNVELPDYSICPVHLGCNNLKKLPEYDEHFKKVAIVLDGDAKTDKTHLLKKYLSGEIFSSFNSKKLPDNCIALPTYLPPESYLYYILFKLINDDSYSSFWRNLDKIPEARLYTKARLKEKIINRIEITDDTSNDSLKNKISIIDELKNFFEKSKALIYFYSKEENKTELKIFLNKCEDVFKIVNARMKASF